MWLFSSPLLAFRRLPAPLLPALRFPCRELPEPGDGRLGVAGREGAQPRWVAWRKDGPAAGPHSVMGSRAAVVSVGFVGVPMEWWRWLRFPLPPAGRVRD